MSENQFAAELHVRGVGDDLGRMIYNAALCYYDGVASPYPDDQPTEPPHSIDGDDLSDICIDIWKKLDLPKGDMPMRLDAISWSEVGVVIERERSRLATHPR